MAERFSDAARAAAVAGLSGWADVEGRDAISKTFTFTDFKGNAVYRFDFPYCALEHPLTNRKMDF